MSDKAGDAEYLLVTADELLAGIADSDGSWLPVISELRNEIESYLLDCGWTRAGEYGSWMPRE